MIALCNEYLVVLDACVLVPMPLCDTLLRLAEEPATYIPKWSEETLRELRSALLRRGYTEAQADRRIAAMEAAFEDAKVVGYQELMPSLKNHPDDRHVLAAAIRSGAHAILTENVKHFPAESVAPYDIAVLTSDRFLVHQFHLSQGLLLEKLRAQAAALRFPLPDLLERLRQWAPSLVSLLTESP